MFYTLTPESSCVSSTEDHSVENFFQSANIKNFDIVSAPIQKPVQHVYILITFIELAIHNYMAKNFYVFNFFGRKK